MHMYVYIYSFCTYEKYYMKIIYSIYIYIYIHIQMCEVWKR